MQWVAWIRPGSVEKEWVKGNRSAWSKAHLYTGDGELACTTKLPLEINCYGGLVFHSIPNHVKQCERCAEIQQKERLKKL